MSELVILGKKSGGSGKGMSFYQAALCCPNRATLSRAEEEDPDGSDAADIGTYFHKLAEAYYLDIPSPVIEFAAINENPAATEAQRLFREYRQRYSPYEFGRVVGCEIQLPKEDDRAARAKLDEEFGAEVTIKPDMVIELDADHADLVSQHRKVEVQPGFYIVDHKTKKAKTRTLHYEMQFRAQFALYQYVWNQLHPDMQVKGLLANIIFRYKNMDEDSFLTLLVPPPSPSEVAVVKGIVRDGARILSERGPSWKNPVHCFDWFRVCPHLMSGDCDRTNPTP